MAKVSIIVPVYNAEKYLDKCLNSLAHQTLKDIEVIAINDGSTDKSLDILEQSINLFGGRLKIIDQKNGGAGSSRNKGLDMATGEFIKLLMRMII